MNTQLVSIGILVILFGFALVVIGSLIGAQKSDTKFAVGGFIGFIPFGFANDKSLLWVVIGLTILVAIILFLLKLQIKYP